MADTHARSNDLALLHPAIRQKVQDVQQALDAEKLPFGVFEAFRSPTRQDRLYAKGRTDLPPPEKIVTNARAWESFHQYGLAVDFVLLVDGKWSWDTSGKRRGWWERMNQLGRDHGLIPLSWELPHLQLAGIPIDKLRVGKWPDGGDESWARNLEAAILAYSGQSKPPPIPTEAGAKALLTLPAK